MIATMGQTARLRHRLAGMTPPSDLSCALYAPDGTEKWTSDLTPPVAVDVSSGAATTETDEAIFVLDYEEAEGEEEVETLTAASGDLVRAVDSLGTIHDCILVGISADDTMKVASFGGKASEVASVWLPEITISIPGDYLDAVGDGWRLEIVSEDEDENEYRTQEYLTVGRLSLDISISPREYMDMYPGGVSDLAEIEARYDWPRLVREAVAEVEAKLLAQAKIYTAIISPVSLRRAVAAALMKLLGSGTVPEQYADSKRDWLDYLRSNFASVMRDCMNSAHYDSDLSGTAADSERLPTTGHRRVRW